MKVVLAGEHGLRASNHHFAQYAPHGPHVNLTRVIGGTEQHLGGTVPTSNDTIGVPVLVLPHESRQSKVTQLEYALLCDQQVGRFEITVQNLSPVTLTQRQEQLFDERFDLTFVERYLGIEQAGQVMLHVLEHHVKDGFIDGGNHLPQVHNVLMVQRLENRNLTDGSDGEALLLAVHANTLQCHNVIGLATSCPEHLAICALTQLFIQDIVVFTVHTHV